MNNLLLYLRLSLKYSKNTLGESKNRPGKGRSVPYFFREI